MFFIRLIGKACQCLLQLMRVVILDQMQQLTTIVQLHQQRRFFDTDVGGVVTGRPYPRQLLGQTALLHQQSRQARWRLLFPLQQALPVSINHGLQGGGQVVAIECVEFWH